MRCPTLYLGLDGTGVPARNTEVEGHKGKQPDGTAKTLKAKIAVVWSAQTTDHDARPVRDPGSATYNAAIESIATRDTDTEPAPFAQRILRETERRGFDKVARQVVLGDGAPWVWNFADEHFPHATQIVDIFHAKGHLFDGRQGHLGTRQRDRPTMGQDAARGARRGPPRRSARRPTLPCRHL